MEGITGVVLLLLREVHEEALANVAVIGITAPGMLQVGGAFRRQVAGKAAADGGLPEAG